MRIRDWVTMGAVSLGVIGTGMAVNSFLPRHLPTWYKEQEFTQSSPYTPSPVDVDISFLRCGSVTIPELIAVRGAFSFAPRVIAYSAVLVRHPKATFLYDTGLCTSISSYVQTRPFFFRKTLGNFKLEQPLSSCLHDLGMQPGDLDFALLSHLHWDHVSGIPDIPGVPLRIHRVEYDAALLSIFEQFGGLSRQLMGNNPFDLFDCDGPPYEGFHSSRDLFGDGSIILVPLPGHTAGNTGMFINRRNGQRLLLVGDAAWVAENFLRPTTMHPFIWSLVTADDATGCQTLIDLHYFSRTHPAVPVIAMHDARMQEAFMAVEVTRNVQSSLRGEVR